MWCYFDDRHIYCTFIDHAFFLILGVAHFVFYFFMNTSDFYNLFDTLETSPLFDFSVNSNCGSYSHLVFHVWGGKYVSTGRRSKKVDVTNIEKINGNFFCYNHISYKDLLLNGQILKKEETCKGSFPFDCGTIDTLEQHLCIKEGEKCPLYDVGIGNQEDTENYIFNEANSNVYYNKDTYNYPNKKIIGKLMLNDGNPCYQITEKLWRQFDSQERAETHLECGLEVFGKSTDDRYEYKGDISYKKIYEDNLSKNNQDLVMDDIKDEKVSLYKREFLGIDKECHMKYDDITKEQNDKLISNQKMEAKCSLVEGILILGSCATLFVITLCTYFSSKHGSTDFLKFSNLFGLFLVSFLLLACIICHSVFLGRILSNNISYDCSDPITNELFRIQKENIDKIIIFTAINIGIDIFIILIHAALWISHCTLDYTSSFRIVRSLF